MTDGTDIDVAVIGAGFSGLASAIRLQQYGVADIVILERADRVGGTWRDARYPGAEVDVPSWLYSLSFAPNPDWSRFNCAAAEIQTYIESTVERFELQSLIRFGAEVVSIDWHEAAGRWLVVCRDGRRWRARTVVAADGLLANAQQPDVMGAERFRGQCILSADWPRSFDPTGLRVGVVGTGASAVQIVPALVGKAAHVTVFQRTPAWVLPRANFDVPAYIRYSFRRWPALQRGARGALFNGYEAATWALVRLTPLTRAVELLARLNLRRQVPDRQLRAVLTPKYRIGCKRPLITSDFYPALQREDCTLVASAVTELTDTAARCADGSSHDLDVLVFATGYDVQGRAGAYSVRGRDGIELTAVWSHGMVGYNSVCVSGFPNLFWTMGPNAFGHSSELLFIEAQVDYLVQGVVAVLTRGLHSLDVRASVQAEHNRSLQARLAHTTFNSGCRSWYLSDDGYNGMMYPGSVRQYRRQLETFDLADYDLGSAS